MKTRELLACAAADLSPKISDLRPKELRRHIDHIAKDLGASDTDALITRILETVLALQELDDSTTDDEAQSSELITQALADQFKVTDENLETVLRLILLCTVYLRLLMRHQVKELQHAGRSPGAHPQAHHEAHRCNDPDCAEHGTHSAPR